MIITLPRLTFRIHDNPLLTPETGVVVVVIERDHLPTESYDMFRANGGRGWNFHQYNLLLKTIRGHKKDLKATGRDLHLCYVDTDDLTTFYSTLMKQCQGLSTDYMTDPKYSNQDQAMSTYRPKIYNTFTLVDWRQPEHKRQLETYFSKAKPFSKLTPLKEHILSSVPFIEQPSVSYKGSATRLLHLDQWIQDIEAEIKKTESKMRSIGMKVHNFGSGSDAVTGASFDDEMLQHAKTGIKFIDSDQWYKPDTAIGLSWDRQSCINGKDTSQLSPFLSIGSLSPKTFWNNIRSNNTNMGSAKDQLLFRECFNAVAAAAQLMPQSRAGEFWSDSITSKFIDHKARDYEWGMDKEIIMEWQQGNISGDAGPSMQELWKNGWIHHLQRHLVADTLTRGRLGQMWTEGMYWFKYTLLDHDAAVNRANWMWLSATAFSSKQKVYHYGETYVQRGTPKTMKAANRDSSCP